MKKNNFLNDLALGHYTSAFDTDFLDKYSRGDMLLVSIGRMIDKCSDFKRLKASIGNTPEQQIESIEAIKGFIDDNSCILGMNIYDALCLHNAMVACLYDEDFERCIGRTPTDKEYAAICAKIKRRKCTSDEAWLDYVFSMVHSVAEAAVDF